MVLYYIQYCTPKSRIVTIYTLIKGSKLHEVILIVPHPLMDQAPPIMYSTSFITYLLIYSLIQ